jgi:hypothetical protein
LWIVVFDVALVLFIVELEAAACLTDIFLVASYAGKRVGAASVIGHGGRSSVGGFGES